MSTSFFMLKIDQIYKINQKINFKSCTRELKILQSGLHYRSDHPTVLLSFQINEFKRGSGIWKLNSSLLKDNDYIKVVKNVYLMLESNTRYPFIIDLFISLPNPSDDLINNLQKRFFQFCLEL